MTIRKIDLMHQMFGMTEHYCRDCLHFGRMLVGDTKKVRKCEVYGVTASEASDWNASYQACGLFNMPYPYKDKQIIRYVKPERKRKIDDEPLDGQIGLDAWTLQGPGDRADMKEEKQ